MASTSLPSSNSVRGLSSIAQNITVGKRELLETCFYKRTKYYYPNHDPKAKEFSPPVYMLFARCYKTQVPNLGVLACLPQELLEGIVLQLDIDSYRRFRQVSRRARHLSTAINIYQRVLRHAPDALNALRRTDLSGHVSYSDIYTALTTTKCAFCGLFGDFLFLPTAKRCCFECLRTSPETALVNEARISRREQWRDLYANYADTLINALKSKDIHAFKTHNWDDAKKMSKTRGVLAKDLLAAYIKVDSTMEVPGQTLLKPGWLHYRLAASIIFPCLNPRTGKLKTGVSCIGCHLNIWKQSNTSLVCMSRENIMFNPSFHARDRSYSEDEAALHFSQCLEAQLVWRKGAKVQCFFVEEGGFTISGRICGGMIPSCSPSEIAIHSKSAQPHYVASQLDSLALAYPEPHALVSIRQAIRDNSAARLSESPIGSVSGLIQILGLSTMPL
ncbi:hypothetical protein FPHYL_2917 [Fusarium phyllophilum]|uniref:F-box domain-containing protein n=1 Tax=Fusarium phyllophilum TaxID=47803 RepID=A0A8H5K5M9_9HYPO|nr:hypothetical protein FPHYL_2917 [Fusarium phyllophilum]